MHQRTPLTMHQTGMTSGRRGRMKCWSLLTGILMVAILTACGNARTGSNVSAPPVPTSPNAAYQTTFPELGATAATVLEGRLGGDVAETPTPEAAPETITEPVFEELTPSPETIDVEEELTPSPETSEGEQETSTATP